MRNFCQNLRFFDAILQNLAETGAFLPIFGMSNTV